MRIAGPTAPPDFLARQIVDRPQALADTVLDNDGFFPVIALRDFTERFQLVDDHRLGRRLQCLQEALLTVNHELESITCEWLRQGYAILAEVPQGLQGDCPALLHHYRTAVYALTLQLMAERFRFIDTTDNGDPKATRSESQVNDWRNVYLTHLGALRGQASWELEASVI